MAELRQSYEVRLGNQVLSGVGNVSLSGMTAPINQDVLSAGYARTGDSVSKVHKGYEYIVEYVVYTDDEDGLNIIEFGHDVVKDQDDLDYRVDFLRPHPKGSKLWYKILVKKEKKELDD